uniref:Reverse transcriptase domain-containing protein n=1 Tax=Leptobrachium leishanense TaxID=445787 RepID=A0A8C5R1N4_9ANUR
MRTLQLMHHARHSSQDLALLSTDAEKAFDRVDWDFISSALMHAGLGPNLRTWIGALYGDTTARVCVNSAFTAPFAIRNGTRQGCPLSPLLFVLTLEPFLTAIRTDPDITGVEVGPRQLKVAAYADDLLFYVTRPEISLPGIMAAFVVYGQLSNLRINFSKSHIMNITIPDRRARALQPHFAFHWAADRIKYLGIWVSKQSSDLFQNNFRPLLRSFQRDLAAWDYPHVSWLGRIAVIKMNIQPRILYLMQTIPIMLPGSFLSLLRSIITKYIWRGRQPRLSFQVLTRSRADGGLALPNFSLYHRACHLQRVVEWTREGSTKLWKAVDQEILGVPIAVLPWLPRGQGGRLARSSPFTWATYKLWRLSAIKAGLTSFPSPMSPVIYNNDFPPGLDPHSVRRLVLVSTPRLSHFIDSKGRRPLTDLMGDRPISFIHSFHYAQVGHFLDRISQRHHLGRQLTTFEGLCCRTRPFSHGLSILYSLLRMASSDVPPPYMGKWESILDIALSEEQWSRICDLPHHCSSSSKAQETAYKVLSLWYRTPDVVSRYCPLVPAPCWRCGEEIGTMLHIWWDCPIIRPFWARIYEILSRFVEPPPAFSPAALLLHHNEYPVSFYKRSLAIRILNTAKALIPLYWKQCICPPLSLWYSRMEELHSIESLMFSASDRLAQYSTIWSLWVLLSSSRDVGVLWQDPE